jgi:hypothetical protein
MVPLQRAGADDLNGAAIVWNDELSDEIAKTVLYGGFAGLFSRFKAGDASRLKQELGIEPSIALCLRRNASLR